MRGRLAVAIASFGYIGFFPVAPGTAGSLAALALFALARRASGPWAEFVAVATVCVVGIWAAGAAEHALGRKDPGPVVIDEVLGMLVTLAYIPVSLAGVALGFLLFRAFDVLKPYPAGRLERLPGGLGVMLDDAAAGLYAHLALRVLVGALPGWLGRG